MKRKQFKWKLIAVFFLALILTSQVSVHADSCSLNVFLEYHRQPLVETKVRIYRIGDVSLQDESYQVESVFKDAVKQDDLKNISTASVNETVSKELCQFISDKHIDSLGEVLTDTNGKASFNGLTPGLYLVETDEPDPYKTIPALIQVPVRNEASGELMNTADVYPKISKNEDPVPSKETEVKENIQVNTGDDTNISLYLFLMMISCGFGIAAIVLRGKENY